MHITEYQMHSLQTVCCEVAPLLIAKQKVKRTLLYSHFFPKVATLA